MTEQAVVETEVKSVEKKLLIDNDKFRKLHSGEVDFDTLNKDEKDEFHDRFVVGGEEVPTVEEEKIIPNPEKETKIAFSTEAKLNEVEEDDSPEEQERRRKYKEVRDQNNTLQQKLKSAQEKLDNIQKMKIEVAPKLDVDEYDDNAKIQNSFNQELANKVNAWVSSESASINKEKSELQQESMYSSISQMQTENPELYTSKSIKSLDNAFVRFRDTIAPGNDNDAKNKAVQEYLSNPEKRKQCESQGILFPFTDTDWKNYQVISAVNTFKANSNYSDHDIAYYAYKKQTGFVPDSIRNATIEAHRQVVNKITNQQSQATLLSPMDGRAGIQDGGMTEAQAEDWLIRNPTPTTPEQVAILKSIMTRFSGKAV